MFHYSHHIGDYAAHTRHLTLLEDLAYRRALELYYLHERPLPAAVEDVARAVGMREQLAEVEAVLREFFVFNEARGGWVNERADNEIAACWEQSRSNSRAGKASAEARRRKAEQARGQQPEQPQPGKPHKFRGRGNTRSTPVEHPLNGRSTGVERPCNHPLPKNQVPPNPPERSLNERGASAARAAPEPDPEPAADSGLLELEDALRATGYRGGLPALARSLELTRRARALAPTGLTPPAVAELWELAQAKAKPRDGEPADPGKLFAHWLDENLWREVLDEQASKRKHQVGRQRGAAANAAADEPFGSAPKPAASMLDDAVRAIAAGSGTA